ncbi:hypothetical protein ZWY2020_032043 [Hordeum vulgare]|nr:hypothetical protein ZWY2020_032043 [Hordeum vulgare]
MLKEEQAAVKAQAAFRGYLARRAFRALKGIIRLQALIRGHHVRRQAASTLRATWLLVKFQAIVRGKNVRLFSDAIQFSLKLAEQKLYALSILGFVRGRRRLCDRVRARRARAGVDMKGVSSIPAAAIFLSPLFLWRVKVAFAPFRRPLMHA